MSGDSSIFSPATVPLLDPPAIRTPLKRRIPAPPEGGIVDWSFEWVWPGLINLPGATSPELIVPAGGQLDLDQYWTTLQYYNSPSGAGSLAVNIQVNGSSVAGAYSLVANSGLQPIFGFGSTIVSPGDRIRLQLASTTVRCGDNFGMWFGIHAEPWP